MQTPIKIFLVSCFLFLVSSASAAAHGGVNDEELIIRMTKNDFEPRELTVVEGDEVLFINNDDTARWPASNFHPTHTLYPEFDPKRGIPTGESWKFKFEKVGTWRMHDHLFPHMTGTIVVLPTPSVVKGENIATTGQGQTLNTNSKGLTLENPSFWAKIKAFFLKLFGRNKASAVSQFRDLNAQGKYARLEEVSAREGPEAAWRLVIDTYSTPEGVVGNPHDMAHLVGQLIFKRFGFERLSICTPVFAFGCYHGLMEVAFNPPAGEAGKDSRQDYQKNLKAAEQGCEKLLNGRTPTGETAYWSCIHGMGHGIATFREHNLSVSLSDCEFLPESIRTYCQDGVFMEFSISAPPKFYDKSNPIYPCDSVDSNAKIACARSQVQVMRLRFNMDTKFIANTCNQSGDKNIIYHCIDALGYYIAQEAQRDTDKIITGCAEIENQAHETQCLAAAAGELVFQDSAGWQKSVGKICKTLSGESHDLCEKRVEQVKKSYGLDGSKTLIRTLRNWD